jgi:hypothetical protein
MHTRQSGRWRLEVFAATLHCPVRRQHDTHNTGAQPLRLIGVYVVEKSKPQTAPGP